MYTCDGRLPAESILDQSSKDAREQFIQRMVAEAPLVFVCYARKSNICEKLCINATTSVFRAAGVFSKSR